ncbi:hypothetical protein OEV98_09430 [Caldibacillus lycopersici]|uniref:Uncharacterized protein n=1 Tax=Perspicuibacillus lycopersici TaxID=1325689 RepID=A0AAE3LND0_9BACI|nr:hypothetical protein [Perspicuibacillus lycopersici]MCU9613781.1 hypothetical protein [Perspicuibacillus lycopersici]
MEQHEADKLMTLRKKKKIMTNDKKFSILFVVANNLIYGEVPKWL